VYSINKKRVLNKKEQENNKKTSFILRTGTFFFSFYPREIEEKLYHFLEFLSLCLV